jgi:quercetin dioxygenase-like cupin family protein
MTRPDAAAGGAVVDVAAIALALLEEAGGSGSGHVARTVVREPDLRIVVMGMRAGATIAEHQARHTAVLQVLRGRVQVTLASGAVEVVAGELLPLAQRAVHDVVAIEPSALVLTLAWSGA